MLIEYSSNNSGGFWWLKDKDWIALEKAGWRVVWGGTYACHSRFGFSEAPEGKPQPCESADECEGHRKCDSAKEAENHRWLGALAREATKEFASIRECLLEFEKITGQTVSDEGCNCCGPPHSFSWRNEKDERCYCSGNYCLHYLYDDVPASFRDAVERLND
jgi:hypothetical protein